MKKAKSSKIHINFLDLTPIENDNYVLQLYNNGPRCSFDSPEEALTCMKVYMSNSNYGDIKFRYNNKMTKNLIGVVDIVYKVALRIHFPSNDLYTNLYVHSDNYELYTILCDKNPIPENEYHYMTTEEIALQCPLYAEFMTFARRRIINIINESQFLETCYYSVINCCRTYPVCNHENIVIKSFNNHHSCYSCNMDLCKGTCGRVYHGENECETTLDEASEMLINTDGKRCPCCRCAIFKDSGCNHMTCNNKSCSTEFCYVCGQEYPQDIYGHYMVTEHYQTTNCLQFNDNR